ncbi:MAG: SDR family NAD(P)-dependent oxidoreductase, partial [Chloroflexota bacterium]
QRRGVIAVISSVAGDRGRGSNYVYGTAMAAKTTFLSGLRNRLAKSGVQVVTVKPGFVDTPMTANIPKNALFASPAKVGKDIYTGLKKGHDVIYTPFFWRYIMWIIRLIPEPIFKRLSL